jgi:hypothetical protein
LRGTAPHRTRLLQPSSSSLNPPASDERGDLATARLCQCAFLGVHTDALLAFNRQRPEQYFCDTLRLGARAAVAARQSTRLARTAGMLPGSPRCCTACVRHIDVRRASRPASGEKSPRPGLSSGGVRFRAPARPNSTSQLRCRPGDATDRSRRLRAGLCRRSAGRR